MCVFLHSFVVIISDLDKGECRSGAEWLCFMLHLIFDVVLHALLLINLLLLLHVEEDSGRHSDGDGIFWLWLKVHRFQMFHFNQNKDAERQHQHLSVGLRLYIFCLSKQLHKKIDMNNLLKSNHYQVTVCKLCELMCQTNPHTRNADSF